jgi:hypothetical protein
MAEVMAYRTVRLDLDVRETRRPGSAPTIDLKGVQVVRGEVRGLRRFALVLAAGVATAALAATPAFAGSTVWDGNGSENLPCEFGGHWILSPGKDVGTATLTVDGVNYPMTQSGGANGAFHGFSAPVDESSTASATWTGTSTEAFLKLSHCLEGQGDTGGDTAGDTAGDDSGDTAGDTAGDDSGDTAGDTAGDDSGDTAGYDSGDTAGDDSGDTAGDTAGDVSGGPTGGTTGGTGGTTGGTTGGSGAAGGELPFTGFPVWLPLLVAAALLASGLFFIRRKKGELH